MLAWEPRRGAGRTSESCARAISTIDMAAGCTISSVFMMVAPSFEITTCNHSPSAFSRCHVRPMPVSGPCIPAIPARQQPQGGQCARKETDGQAVAPVGASARASEAGRPPPPAASPRAPRPTARAHAVAVGSHLAVAVDELVHAARAQGGAHDIGHGRARVDVGNQLRLALRGVGTLLEQNDRGLHAHPSTHPHAAARHRAPLRCTAVHALRLRVSVPACSWCSLFTPDQFSCLSRATSLPRNALHVGNFVFVVCKHSENQIQFSESEMILFCFPFFLYKLPPF